MTKRGQRLFFGVSFFLFRILVQKSEEWTEEDREEVPEHYCFNKLGLSKLILSSVFLTVWSVSASEKSSFQSSEKSSLVSLVQIWLFSSLTRLNGLCLLGLHGALEAQHTAACVSIRQHSSAYSPSSAIFLKMAGPHFLKMTCCVLNGLLRLHVCLLLSEQCLCRSESSS